MPLNREYLFTGTLSCIGFVIGFLANALVLAHLLIKAWLRWSSSRALAARGVTMPSSRVAMTSRDALLMMLTIADLVVALLNVTTAAGLINGEPGGRNGGP